MIKITLNATLNGHIPDKGIYPSYPAQLEFKRFRSGGIPSWTETAGFQVG